MNEGWNKFGIHAVGWFSVITLVLVLACLSGAPFAWPWVGAVFVVDLLNTLWGEFQEWRLGAQNGEKALLDLLSKICGKAAACLGAGIWWWVR